MVVWIIGLSGAGKTTLSNLVYRQLKPLLPNLVRLDGDVIRSLFGNDADHSLAGRRKNAQRLSFLSKFLSDQGIHVIAAVLSIFPEWRKWNRDNINAYAEVYLKVSMEVLKKRDRNNLYIPAFEGELKDVVGVDINFPEPEKPDLVIDNNKENDSLEGLKEKVVLLPVIQEALKNRR